MIKEGGLFGIDAFHFFIKFHTKNYCDRAFNSIAVLYWKKNVFTFEKYCEIFNTKNNVEVIQMFQENFFELE